MEVGGRRELFRCRALVTLEVPNVVKDIYRYLHALMD